MWKILEFTCSECGCNARNHYRDVDYVEHAHDSFLLELGLLMCGNCENNAEIIEQKQDHENALGSEFYEPGPYKS